MEELIKKLCLANGVSGREDAVRNIIIEEIKNYCTVNVDALGNIIAQKDGKNPDSKIMLDAHMDEVGIIATYITEDGFIKFTDIGGINTECLLSRKVVFENGTVGVICTKPVHLLANGEKDKLPKAEALVIDIGADSKARAQERVLPGDTAVFYPNFYKNCDTVMSKAIDDRIGCAVLINLIKTSEYAFCAVFSVQEEVGARGAQVAAFSINPDFCICLETTTAADIYGVPDEKRVCLVGNGPAISFMDRGTLYDRKLFNAAMQSGIKCQAKTAVVGGNNSMTVHKTRDGVRTVTISVPTRYIHSSDSLADMKDVENAKLMAEYLINAIGEKRV